MPVLHRMGRRAEERGQNGSRARCRHRAPMLPQCAPSAVRCPDAPVRSTSGARSGNPALALEWPVSHRPAYVPAPPAPKRCPRPTRAQAPPGPTRALTPSRPNTHASAVPPRRRPDVVPPRPSAIPSRPHPGAHEAWRRTVRVFRACPCPSRHHRARGGRPGVGSGGERPRRGRGALSNPLRRLPYGAGQGHGPGPPGHAGDELCADSLRRDARQDARTRPGPRPRRVRTAHRLRRRRCRERSARRGVLRGADHLPRRRRSRLGIRFGQYALPTRRPASTRATSARSNSLGPSACPT